MSKGLKIVIIICAVCLCFFVVWYLFMKENKQIQAYEEKQKEKAEQIEQMPIDNNLIEVPNSEENPNVLPDNQSIIITSDDKELNEKGKELLNELSKELEQSLLTISNANGIVDEDILNEENGD